MKKGGFWKSNWVYLIWFLFYFMISFLIINIFTPSVYISLAITFGIYAVTIAFALSPIGEAIARSNMGARPINANEYGFVIKVFDEVYQKALEECPRLSKNIKLYYIEDDDVNAFAFGRTTVAVTKGAIDEFGREEMQGIIGHEFGHLAHGDTKSLLLNTIGNGFLSLVIAIVSLAIRLFDWFMSHWADATIVRYLLRVVSGVLRFVIWVFISIGDLILSINSRYSEYLADSFSSDIGYNKGLTQALSTLQGLSNDKRSILSRLKSSHPLLEKRIERLKQ